jgi:protein ImuB
MKRYVAIWFRHLLTDRILHRQPELAGTPFVLAAKQRGRMVIMVTGRKAEMAGIEVGMVVADARAILPTLEVLDFDPEIPEKLLNKLAEWMIRYSPLVAVDMPDGLIVDATGCTHLWGSEAAYLKDIATRLKASGYDVKTAMADTIGTAWAISRYSRAFPIIRSGAQLNALLTLPPHALRLDNQTLQKMSKLGLRQVKDFISMPASTLRRRFGQATLDQIGKALGHVEERFVPVQPFEPYQERLSSLEPICTATGIEIALQTLLDKLCKRLADAELGLRKAVLTCYRIDGEIQQISVGTNAPSSSASHLFKLFEQNVSQIEPALGIELFVLDAPVVEPRYNPQESLWQQNGRYCRASRPVNGPCRCRRFHRYLPAEHHWPERAMTEASTLNESPTTDWRTDQLRPIQLLAKPERIEVTAPLPDYPPMLFRHKGAVHKLKRADGPDRIEQEWWIADGLHRDYYAVEDEQGARYWIFRLGHYGDEQSPEWFIHGFFA